METEAEEALWFAVPTVSAIIERQHQGRTQVLIQVRWKPDKDPVYSGAFEIPAGGIYQSENVYDALKREVFEETGLRVTAIRPDVKTPEHCNTVMTSSASCPSVAINSSAERPASASFS